MEDKPWWFYACEIVVLAGAIAVLGFAISYEWGRTQSSYAGPLNLSTVSLILGGVFVVAIIAVLLRFARDKDQGLWGFILGFFWWL